MSFTTPIHDFITDYLKADTVSFHMPGHKGSQFYKRFGYHDFLNQMMDYDITEIDGADNLFQTEGIIKATQDKYAKLYNVKKSYLMINGTSGGNLAAILASVNKGKKLIMARNCHKSVYNALTLGDIQPVYAYPETNHEFKISGVITPEEIERLVIENPDAEAVILSSPNYYGICSDIEAIADIVHQHGRILIVDEAHGAHLHFSDALPLSAMQAGADLVINSTHKTLGSFTQSAALHLNSDRVDQYTLEDKLQCIESTSPSYLLMTSLDITATILENHGDQLMEDWISNLEYFYERIKGIPGLKTMGRLKGLDWTKINLSMRELGLSGAELEKILMKEYSIYMELATGDIVMGMSGIGNVKEDYEKLALALEDLSERRRNEISLGTLDITINSSSETQTESKSSETGLEAKALPKQAVMVGIPKTKRRVKLSESAGLVCASSIIPYPPGIPLVCPGERIEADAIAYVQALRAAGEKVIGITENDEVIVG